MIDIMNLRQSYEKREIIEMKWIMRNNNPADFMYSTVHTYNKVHTAHKKFIERKNQYEKQQTIDVNSKGVECNICPMPPPTNQKDGIFARPNQS
jgi:hypothetical protein